MNEFNFFGAKGELKDVQKIIDEKVQIRLSEQNDTKIREEEIAKINKDLDSAKESKETLQQKADKNLELARKIFRLYKTLSNKHEETTQELNILRQKQKERDDRMAIIEELRRRRNEQVHQSRYSTVEETPDQDKHECK